eukprot:Gregarina_sp_Poly_1__7695@NODE_4337_length_637_cov_98_012281_g201_i1_p1_GENE_NODE_4337_length_637_cov_98_012281_g201_i1NODE_4337_length_637_cov_98_012281_g201_i1_p1_ORF_typecomplete_len174_score16_54TIL/PF01826_17/0_0098TIL/PF01826_17/1_6e04_NODE_4337_length_637_cov_98_012281_g201_i1116601
MKRVAPFASILTLGGLGAWEDTILATSNQIKSIDCDADREYYGCRQACRQSCQPLSDFDACLESMPEGCSFDMEGVFQQTSSGCKIEMFHEPLGDKNIDQASGPTYDNWTAVTTPVHFPFPLQRSVLLDFEWALNFHEGSNWTYLSNCDNPHVSVSVKLNL